MRVRNDFERRVRTIPNTWITLADGVRLAARIWLPEDAETDPVPAILEYIPYRKNDGTALRDAEHAPLVRRPRLRGVRVDMRGSGDSDGLLLDEYLQQEQDDALEVIAWLAAQPWCTRPVGIIGISWGGFNGLQIAAQRPPALTASITVCSTDDRYADDVHYMGGCLLGADMLSWASTMLAYNARPPDPARVGERWRELLARAAGGDAAVRRGVDRRTSAATRSGSTARSARTSAPSRCPVYMVGGWADGYTRRRPAPARRLGGPAQGADRPLGAPVPAVGAPGPAIGFLQECCAGGITG